ncbi:MAG: single-stranded-DNA-specific exonuclease RecJ [Oscillospiraceae bacterium]|nr:single-stranded-DNA-specific exonuclease RecJ [Oscillospiraceae bacterium]
MLRLIQRSVPEAAVGELRDAGYPIALARLLARHGVETPEQAREFLNPSEKQLRDPFVLTGMLRATEVIGQAVNAGERITIFGDYDVDGICAAALLSEALIRHGANVSVHIPERHGEGYGLTIPALERLRPGCDLLITVDCGITAVDEARWAKMNSLRLIITDHHEPLDTLPCCEALVDPAINAPKGSPLCGAGVAFKLVQALYGWSEASRALDLVAMATVADLVPLLGENRVIVALGLEAIQRTERIGLRALINVAGLEGKPLNAGHVGFQLTPRLNSAGRIGNAARNVDLLLTCDQDEAREIADELNANNERRQTIQRVLTKEAEKRALEITDFRRDRLVAPDGVGWNTGVIGLAASALTDKYHLPAIVFSVDEKDGALIAVGSARSIPGVHIQRAMFTCRDLFTRFGGHAQAAGCTLPAERLPELRERLNRAIIEQTDPEAFIPSERYDAVITLRDMTIQFIETLKQLEPHGIGNPAPTFLISDARTANARKVGADRRHLKLRLFQDNVGVDGIAFGQADQYADRLEDLPDRMDALVHCSINEYMGARTVQFIGQRLLPSSPLDSFERRCRVMRGRFERALAEMIMEPPQPAADVYPLPQAELRALASDAIRADYQGVLLVTRTFATALDWAGWLRRSDLAGRVDYVTTAPRDPRAFHTLAALPSLMELSARYDRVAFLDLPPNIGELAIIRNACPGALIWLDEDAQDWEADAASLAPSEDTLRALYRTLRRPGVRPSSVDTYALMFDVSAAAICLGLNVFAQLGLIEWIEEPFSCILLSQANQPGGQPKRSLDESALYRRMKQLRARYDLDNSASSAADGRTTVEVSL